MPTYASDVIARVERKAVSRPVSTDPDETFFYTDHYAVVRTPVDGGVVTTTSPHYSGADAEIRLQAWLDAVVLGVNLALTHLGELRAGIDLTS